MAEYFKIFIIQPELDRDWFKQSVISVQIQTYQLPKNIIWVDAVEGGSVLHFMPEVEIMEWYLLFNGHINTRNPRRFYGFTDLNTALIYKFKKS